MAIRRFRNRIFLLRVKYVDRMCNQVVAVVVTVVVTVVATVIGVVTAVVVFTVTVVAMYHN